MSRYLIRNPVGLYYTGNEVPETRWVPNPDNPRENFPRAMLKPEFESMNVLNCVKYATVADALAMLAHPDLISADVFAGCAVFECEFDTEAPQAVREPNNP